MAREGPSARGGEVGDLVEVGDPLLRGGDGEPRERWGERDAREPRVSCWSGDAASWITSIMSADLQARSHTAQHTRDRCEPVELKRHHTRNMTSSTTAPLRTE